MSSIGRRFDRESSSIFSVISPTGGIRPPDRRHAKQALSLSEREEISRRLSMRCSLRSIARHLGRSPSTISREVQRNGGADCYRAAGSDQAAWDRARRPKLCKLACRPFLRRTVSTLLQRQWSPEQVAGWLKRKYPGEPQKQVSHETINRSLLSCASSSATARSYSRCCGGNTHSTMCARSCGRLELTCLAGWREPDRQSVRGPALASTPLIGREEEIALLARRAERAKAGDGSVA